MKSLEGEKSMSFKDELSASMKTPTSLSLEMRITFN